MKNKKYNPILLFITIAILATIGLQIYWNIKNYKENKLRLVNEVQIAFDNSIDSYYLLDSKNDLFSFKEQLPVTNYSTAENIDLQPTKTNEKHLPTVIVAKREAEKTQITISNDTNALQKKDPPIPFPITLFIKNDSGVVKTDTNPLKISPNKISSVHVYKGKSNPESATQIKNFATKLVISMVRDSIDFTKISAALDQELSRKNIQVQYSIAYYKENKLFDYFPRQKLAAFPLVTYSKSSYLPPKQKLQLSFSNPVALVFKRSSVEILLSLFLSFSIIGCLLYLLKTINKQKKIDEIKNDLISNITHEFKTPITTVATAIEGIRHFNANNDPQKTERYLDISSQQLKKLETMVEKLLETAALNTDVLMIEHKDTDIITLIAAQIEKHSMICPEKNIVFRTELISAIAPIDYFHFENALSNLIDNALKYGGDTITIRLHATSDALQITVEDNGIGIEKNQREKIFEKFYRIQSGNRHDIKGFGIGLFYAKKIIEKHTGILELVPNSPITIFKITLPNG
ncbi:sensor histidine kinase [Flavobacterium kingsejongi]|uniref:histidine kinase n=1 Tax=Flavobacterium kingsejongi TaxID=1678728 RepID=A0A2S1LNF2_9FLAO|nr:HAMP domain-containing sensor histidine kinase [Flavobacterium kingsejongi]AWG25156.1 hypothetical protein FK004_07865 [Flavobacterium kingsejongi]